MNRNRTRLLLSIVMLLCSTLTAVAVPTNPRPFTVTQKDGTQLELRFIGDENYAYYATLDGMPLVKHEGNFYYATLSAQGELAATNILAHNQLLRQPSEESYILSNRPRLSRHVQEIWSQQLEKRNLQREQKLEARRVREKAFGHPTSYKGEKRGIVILVNYADLEMKPTSSVQAWHDQFNKPGYNKNNHLGSVRDYFLDQSYQQLSIDFDVVGPYTVSQGWRYYGKNRDGNNTSDQHPCQLVSEACKLANADVNFKDYDWNGDGEVDQVFVVYAGYGAAAGYDPDAIWPHEWHLDYGAYYGDGQGALKLDGVKIDNYAVSCELNGTSGSTMDPIGTAVHEFSHCLGLPDFYDVDGKGTQCMDYWDVLDAGCYSGPNWRGEVPTGYTAYERNFAGWLKYEELNQPCRITGMESLGDTPQAYIYYNKGNKNEYFILENRRAERWFKYPVGAHGLFVYHVDYDRNAWESDRPNSDPAHPRMTFIPADKSYDRSHTGQMVSDFFPGTSNVKSLTNTSHTSCFGKMFNKNSDGTFNTNMELTSITENSAGKISFLFNGGEAAVKKQLNALLDEVKVLLETPHQDAEDGATEALQEAIATSEAERDNSSTTEEYQATMKTLQKAAAQFLFDTNPTDTLQPYDISFLMVNPSITNNEGWKEETENNGYACSNNCGEYTNLKFNLSQTISQKLPKGRYTATVQAFQRTGTLEESAHNAVNTLLFARSKTQKVKNILDEACEARKSTNDAKTADGLYVPGNQKSASAYFKAGLYTNSVDFENSIVSGTSVKLGIRSSAAKPDFWTCFTNFRLYYRGDPDMMVDDKVDAIRSISTPTPAPAFDLQGRPVSGKPQKQGIYIQGRRKIVVK